jgi:hypothetical protein
LDEEVLDEQVYNGSMTSSDNGSKHEYIPSNIINVPRDEDELQADFKKHLNLDFEEEN